MNTRWASLFIFGVHCKLRLYHQKVLLSSILLDKLPWLLHRYRGTRRTLLSLLLDRQNSTIFWIWQPMIAPLIQTFFSFCCNLNKDKKCIKPIFIILLHQITFFLNYLYTLEMFYPTSNRYVWSIDVIV